MNTACPACGARVPQLATQAEELERLRGELTEVRYENAQKVAWFEAQLTKQSAVVEAARWVDSMDHPSPEAKAGLHAALDALTTTDPGETWLTPQQREAAMNWKPTTDTGEPDYRMSDEPGDLERKFLDDAL